ncbi:MAG: exo-alpha-sialidase [Kiritimatiellae bacterium]|nr:exo-alpha-sialidase [Kiritimatiellia bacterium]
MSLKTKITVIVSMLTIVLIPACSLALEIVWDKPHTLAAGTYARVHRLTDKRLMLSYEKGGQSYIQFSSDEAQSWSSPLLAFPRQHVSDPVWGNASLNACNPEFAQLSSRNPHHPNRILLACNMRPQKPFSVRSPYAIAIRVSDTLGTTWSEMKILYQSNPRHDSDGDARWGCWEPFILELPDGTVQLYFADETPYHVKQRKYQNISVMESADGGETWGKPRIACYKAAARDGMPVATIHDGYIYLAIESNLNGRHLHPEIISSPIVGNWSTPVSGNSPFRFHPDRLCDAYRNFKSGAPYLIQTDNYFVLSYQTTEGSGCEVSDKHAVMEVTAVQKTKMRSGKVPIFQGRTRPLHLNPKESRGLWNSLCPLSTDTFLAVTSSNGVLVTIQGTIRPWQ